ncbi:MAG: hypothetical protein M1609_07630 [Firmicutes bacterium]|nr:hypothetical protein [Bacillota bacterium]
MKKKKSAKTRADNAKKKDTFQAELGQITEMVEGRINQTFIIERDGESTVRIDRTTLIYIAAQVIANVDPWHDRKVNRYQYLKNKFSWDNDLLKSGAYNLLYHDWDTFRQLLETLDELQLLEVIMEWPAVARGLKGAEGWFLQQVPEVESEELPARRYLDKNGKVIFVSDGLWSSGDEKEYGTFWESVSGGHHRVKTQAMPMVASQEEAQRNLDAWAEKNGLQLVGEGDEECRSA